MVSGNRRAATAGTAAAAGAIGGRGSERRRGSLNTPPPGIPPPPQPQALPPLNEAQVQYGAMLRRTGLNDAAILALEGFGLDSLEAIYDLQEDDIPAITKELRRTGKIIKQSSQNFLQALRYWIMCQERLLRNYATQDLLTW
jgi:hypothetical protein